MLPAYMHNSRLCFHAFFPVVTMYMVTLSRLMKCQCRVGGFVSSHCRVLTGG